MVANIQGTTRIPPHASRACPRERGLAWSTQRFSKSCRAFQHPSQAPSLSFLRKTNTPAWKLTSTNHRTQQYSIVAISNASGSVVERVAYTAYGQPTFTNASGSALSSSAKATRYTYTGREWDSALELHHFRARWMSGVSGRFVGRDPNGYEDGGNLYSNYFGENNADPFGTEEVDVEYGNSIWGYYYRKTTRFEDWQKVEKEITFPVHDVVCRCGNMGRENAVSVGFSIQANFEIHAQAILKYLALTGVSVGGTITNTLNMQCPDWSDCVGDRELKRRPRATITYEVRHYESHYEYQTDVYDWVWNSGYPVWQKVGFRWNHWYNTSGYQVRDFAVAWDDYVVSDTGNCCCFK